MSFIGILYPLQLLWEGKSAIIFLHEAVKLARFFLILSLTNLVPVSALARPTCRLLPHHMLSSVTSLQAYSLRARLRLRPVVCHWLLPAIVNEGSSFEQLCNQASWKTKRSNLCREGNTSVSFPGLLHTSSLLIHLFAACRHHHRQSAPTYVYKFVFPFLFISFLVSPLLLFHFSSLSFLFPLCLFLDWLSLVRWMCAFPGQMALLLLRVPSSHFNTRPPCLAWRAIAWGKNSTDALCSSLHGCSQLFCFWVDPRTLGTIIHRFILQRSRLFLFKNLSVQ